MRKRLAVVLSVLIVFISCFVVVIKVFDDAWRRPYREAERELMWANHLSEAILIRHRETAKWPASPEELPDIGTDGKRLEFLPVENNRLACKIIVNTKFEIWIHKSGQTEIVTSKRPCRQQLDHSGCWRSDEIIGGSEFARTVMKCPVEVEHRRNLFFRTLDREEKTRQRSAWESRHQQSPTSTVRRSKRCLGYCCA